MTRTHHISLTSHINHITRKIIPTHLTQHLTHAHQTQATLSTVTMPLGNKSSIIKVNAWVHTLAPSPHHTFPHAITFNLFLSHDLRSTPSHHILHTKHTHNSNLYVQLKYQQHNQQDPSFYFFLKLSKSLPLTKLF